MYSSMTAPHMCQVQAGFRLGCGQIIRLPRSESLNVSAGLWSSPICCSTSPDNSVILSILMRTATPRAFRIPVQFGLDAAVHDFLANGTVFVDGCPAVEPPPHPVGGVGVVDNDLRILGNVVQGRPLGPLPIGQRISMSKAITLPLGLIWGSPSLEAVPTRQEYPSAKALSNRDTISSVKLLILVYLLRSNGSL